MTFRKGAGSAVRDEILTGYSVQAFMADPANHGWKAETRRRYGLCLGELADYLVQNAPPGAEPDRPLLEAWRQQVESRFTGSTVNAYLAAANNYFRWCGRPDLTLRRERPAAEEERPFPAVTRVEYLKLLRAARALGRRRAYLLVKLFANTDLPLYCLDQLTVERIRQGRAELDYRGSPVDFRCPPSLQAELLAYAAAAGVYRGPLFVTRRGQLLNRSNIFRSLQELCRAAGVPEEKGSPRSLRKLYKETQAAIRQSLASLQDQMLDQMLELEQPGVAWPSDQPAGRGRPA